MKENIKYFPTNKFPILSWMLIPILISWIALNYLIGIIEQPNRTNQTFNTAADKIYQDISAVNWDFNWQKTGLVTFWFDDGWITQYSTAAPYLEDRKFVAALSVPTSAVGTNNYMNWAQIERLQFKGWEITSHSRSHSCEPDKLTDQQMQEELLGAKQDLILQGLATQVFVPPCGISNQKLIAEAKKDYAGLRTSRYGVNSIPVSDPYDLLVIEIDNTVVVKEISEWVDQVKKDRKWLILMFHKIDNSNERFSSPSETFYKIVDIVERSGLPVVTPRQVLQISQ